MDFQKYADAFDSPTCIISVEKTENGGYGEIRIVAGNRKYADMMDKRFTPDDDPSSFIPGFVYTDYFPQNRNFEDVCFKAAIQKTEVHTYAHLNNIDLWFEIYAMPLSFEDGNTFYCSYTSTPQQSVDSILSTIRTAQTSNDVLKTCIKLHKADNLEDAMKSVISDIRVICNAECCTVLLINYNKAEYNILATDFRPGSTIKRVSQFNNFFDIAASWKDTLGEEGDCIIIQNEDDMDRYRVINNPWYLTLVEAGVKSVVLFPLRTGNEILGFIWATNFDTDKTMQIKETLELTTFFISSHIARYKVHKHLEYMSYTDALTELPNRFASSEYVRRLIRLRERFTAVSVDLNNFKSINDTLGFAAGNQVLIETARRWKAVSGSGNSTSNDHIARISGDEFMIVIRGYQTEKELRERINRYVDALSERVTVDCCDLYVTASFGYAEYPTDAGTADMLSSYANAAMSEVKKKGNSDRVLRYSPAVNRKEHSLEIENLIRNALEKDTVYFNLQPQYDMEHRLRGFEALARMKNNAGMNISPGDFIPVAEKTGLIDKVDGAVFRKAAAFFGRLLKETGADLTLSLNASVRHLMKNDFIDEIKALLKDSEIPADKLEIEITESIMIDSAEKALKCIDELKNMGIKIAIDDFGTGYSSLSYLNKFPANLLKIDKSFIDKMNTGESSRQYVAAIISIGHIMGFDVISEGVETEEQLETLRNIGCDFIQGFIWGRPLEEKDAEELVTGMANDKV